MKILQRKFSLVSCSVLIVVVLFSVGAQAQRTRKPTVTKNAQMNLLANQALKEMESGRTEKAVEIFTKCIALKPTFDNAYKCYAGRGTAYFILENYEKAIPDLTAAYDNSLDKTILYTRGRAYYEAQRYEEASRDFFRLKLSVKENEIDKNFSDFYKNSGAVYLHLNKYDYAIADFNSDLEIHPQSSDSYFGRAIAYELSGDFEKAEKDLQKMLELDPASKELVEKTLQRIKTEKAQAADDSKKSGKPEDE